MTDNQPIAEWPSPDFDAAVEFRSTLNEETDRGCALMAAAHLDDRLGELLTSYFVDDPKVAKDLLGQSRPLGTFSARIDVAYSVGLLSRDEHKALHLIRKIRNDFGHVAKPLSFENPVISGRCKSLDQLSFLSRSNHKAMFTGAVMSVLAGINFRRRTFKHRNIPKDVSPLLRAARASEGKPTTESKGFPQFKNAVSGILTATPQEEIQAFAKFQSVVSDMVGSDISAQIAQLIIKRIRSHKKK